MFNELFIMMESCEVPYCKSCKQKHSKFSHHCNYEPSFIFTIIKPPYPNNIPAQIGPDQILIQSITDGSYMWIGVPLGDYIDKGWSLCGCPFR